MLTSSFIFLPGVGPVTERRWWQEGLFDWRSFLDRPFVAGLSEHRKIWYDEQLREAQSLTEKGHVHMFGSRLPRRDHWRLYETCRSRAGYLDIETTGASPESGEVTVVGFHREGQTTSLVRGENLTAARLQTELDHCTLLVTFFGSVFDVPYLCAKFPGLRFPTLHFDLCFAARRLALRGGLKHIEQEMGIDRNTTISGLDGLDAVRLWFQWRRGDTIARDTLLSYNRADTENLVLLANRFYEEMVSRFGPSSLSTTLQPAHSR
ncbi:MAG: ribonuclease H-like domain-containing protein [Nitrospira sp.]